MNEIDLIIAALLALSKKRIEKTAGNKLEELCSKFYTGIKNKLDKWFSKEKVAELESQLKNSEALESQQSNMITMLTTAEIGKDEYIIDMAKKVLAELGEATSDSSSTNIKIKSRGDRNIVIGQAKNVNLNKGSED